MIKFYAYYSVGGYKDFFLGDSNQSATSTYLLPRLSQLLESKDPLKRAKGEKQLELPKIEAISINDNHGLPDECFSLFTHGGYRAMYLDLKSANGRCFVVRDLNNGNKDEEGRTVPFVFAIVADEVADMQMLDSFAIRYCSQMATLDNMLGALLSYDGIQNGIRFDLRKCLDIVKEATPVSFRSTHKEIKYMVVGSLDLAKIVCKELKFDQKGVECILSNDGQPIYGRLEILGEEYNPIIKRELPTDSDKTTKDISIISERNNRIEENSSDISESKDDKFSDDGKQISLGDVVKIEEMLRSIEAKIGPTDQVFTQRAWMQLGQSFSSIESQLKSIIAKVSQSDYNSVMEQLRAIENQLASLTSKTEQRYEKALHEIESLKSVLRNAEHQPESSKDYWKDPKVWMIIGAIVVAMLILIIVK